MCCARAMFFFLFRKRFMGGFTLRCALRFRSGRVSLRGRVGVLRQAVRKIRGTEIVPGGRRRGLHAVHIDPAARLLIAGALRAAGGRRG